MRQAHAFAFSGVFALLMTASAFGDIAGGSSSGVIALNSLPNAPVTLATAKVVDENGTPVGAVQKVVMDASGKPVSVAVALLGTGAVVAVNADRFNYDQGANVLMAHLEAQELVKANPG